MLIVVLTGFLALAQSQREPGCTEWRDCREMALAAADRGEYETFHDLAWGRVQTGPKNDPAPRQLPARAQPLSGRRPDALGMLDRLAHMGVASDGDTSPDFERTRALPGWPEVAARIERLHPPRPAPPPAPVAEPLAAPPPPPPPA